MEIKPNEVIYKKGSDPNIILKYRLEESEIHLDKLQVQVDDLDEKVKGLPAHIDIPVDATGDATGDAKKAMEMWNKQDASGSYKLKCQKSFDDKNSLLTELKGL